MMNPKLKQDDILILSKAHFIALNKKY